MRVIWGLNARSVAWWSRVDEGQEKQRIGAPL
jgi:hypothetical protein